MTINKENYSQAITDIENGLTHGEHNENAKIRDTFLKLKEAFETYRKGADTVLGDNKVLKIGVVGQVKAGKSSFLNSLFFDGENVLPRASTPMTAGLTVLEYGEDNEFSVDYYNDREWSTFEGKAREYDNAISDFKANNPQVAQALNDEEIAKQLGLPDDAKSAKELVSNCSPAARAKVNMKADTKAFSDIRDLQDILADYVGADGRFTSVVKSLTIHLNDERLKDLRIVDTPGVNDPIQSREYRTREFLRECHGVFLLSYSGRFFDSTDVNFLSGRIGSEGIGTVVLIASKFDSVLQDVGTKFPDALADAWEDCERQLKKQFRRNLATADYKGEEPRFTVSSGIGFSIYKKPRDRWDTVEAHVVEQMKRFYPSNFGTDEDIKDTFFNLANIDEIRDKYLDGVFIKNRDKIIQDKMNGYFANATTNLTKAIDDKRRALADHVKFLDSTDVSEKKKVREATEKIGNDFKRSVERLANVCDQKAEEMRKRAWNSVSLSWNGTIPTTDEEVTANRKSTFWGSDKSFQFSYRKVDAQKLIDTLVKDFKRYADELAQSWEQGTDKILNAIDKEIGYIITEAEKRDTEAHVDADSLRDILAETIAEMSNEKNLELKNIVERAKEEVINAAQDCEITTSFGSMEESEARSNMKTEANEKKDKIRVDVQRICSAFQDDMKTMLEASKNGVTDVFKGRKEELKRKANESIGAYLAQLDKDLENKEQELAQYKEAIAEIDKIKQKL